MNTFAITSLLACSLAIGCEGVVAGPTLSPDDSSKVLYFGRVDVGQPKTPRFSWPMTGFSVTFHGSQTVLGSFIFPSSGGRLRVIVDGATHGFVKQDGNNILGAMKQYTLAENLDAEKSHTLQVFKITEDNWKPCPSLKCPHHGMTFGGLQLDAGSLTVRPKHCLADWSSSVILTLPVGAQMAVQRVKVTLRIHTRTRMSLGPNSCRVRLALKQWSRQSVVGV